MRVDLLGPVELYHAGYRIHLAGMHQCALLAALASEIGKVVSAERLIDIMWGDRPPNSARAKLQSHVSAIRSAIALCSPSTDARNWPLCTRAPGYLLCAEDVVVDLIEYQEYIESAGIASARGELTEASMLFAKALALWRGAALANARTPVLSGIASTLERGRLLTVERKAGCDLRLGRNATVISILGAVLAEYPLLEYARATMMLALYRCGRRGEALHCYHAGRQAMQDEVGIEPGPQLRRLHQLILLDSPELANWDAVDWAADDRAAEDPSPRR